MVLPFEVRMEGEQTSKTDLTRLHNDLDRGRRQVREFDLEICKMIFSGLPQDGHTHICYDVVHLKLV